MIDIYKSAMGVVARLQECVGFQWDEGNAGMSLEKHDVGDGECEEIFFNLPLVVGEDQEHSEDESRGLALGQTNAGRYLFVAFTIRNQLVRVISARDMTRSERKRLER